MILLLLTLARVTPLGLKAKFSTSAVFPVRVFNFVLLSKSHRIIFLLLSPQTKVLPSGLKAMNDQLLYSQIKKFKSKIFEPAINQRGSLRQFTESASKVCVALNSASRFALDVTVESIRLTYRRKVCRRECPVVFITSEAGIPARTILVFAECRRSWKRNFSTFAIRHAVANDRLKSLNSKSRSPSSFSRC